MTEGNHDAPVEIEVDSKMETRAMKGRAPEIPDGPMASTQERIRVAPLDGDRGRWTDVLQGRRRYKWETQFVTEEEIARTPFLFRRRKVLAALEWLQKNNRYYHDVIISRENLNKYEDGHLPVPYIHRETDGSVSIESRAVFDDEAEKGVEDGPCPLSVVGVVPDAAEGRRGDHDDHEVEDPVGGGGEGVGWGTDGEGGDFRRVEPSECTR